MEKQTDTKVGCHRRIILFPLPYQGHINPMLQLANLLYSKGFSITILHTNFNKPKTSNYPHFTFRFILDNDPHDKRYSKLPSQGLGSFARIILFNECGADELRHQLELELSKKDEPPVSCLVTDALWHFTQSVADSLSLPRLVLRTSSLFSFPIYASIPLFHDLGYLNLSENNHSDYEASVPEYPLLKFKDIVKITSNPQGMGDFVTNMLNQMKASSGIIWNTFKELEESSLETLSQDFPTPSFTLGPFHKYFPASSSSLIEQDQTILSWLDKQPPKSVVYVSYGSGARITESEFQEVAHGLANISLPFLWVVRPGMVTGSEWVESLPENFKERVGDRGRIVKWSPQQEVLAHPATGCFWTHNGWNSTLESICEGVPMICSPCYVDQPVNARYVSDVWKIGVMLEDGIERVGIEMAIKRVMMDKEGEEIRERISCLKEKVNVSLDEGGSSFQSLNNLVDYISSF
ncbi:hypothetical protein SSX86_018292 [Deinandra increscens subsp. villosa]|uniref:UDP-glycosyltransferase n=1 Tax=Deinandra increscens subsp. villosa TaxID=3103831 RepID=A0AAP0CVR9_9ASTR